MLQQQPTRLTIDGILQLINKNTFQGQSFVLQTLLLTDNYLGHHYTEISDGYCQVQCQLQDQAKEMVKGGKIKDYDIVRFTTNECEVIEDTKNPYIILNKCQVIKSEFTKTIGCPMPLKLYKDNGYLNPQASNLIQTGPHIYTIKQVINNTRIKNGHLRATVTKLPNNISRGFCIIHLKDAEGTEIQAVGFQEAAELFLKELRLNQEYVFSGFVLNKNKKNNLDELKFKKQAQVSKILKNQQSQTLVKIQNKAYLPFEQPSSHQSHQSDHQQQDPVITKQKLIELIRDDQVQNKFFTIVGKLTYLNPKSTFRKINVEDLNGDVIDMVLWEEIKDVLIMEKIYKFTDLRVKCKPDMKDSKYVQMHSTKNTTISNIDHIQFQLMIAQSRHIKPAQYKPRPYNPSSQLTQQQSYRRQKTKKLFDNSKVITIHQLIEISQQQGGQDNGVTVYPLVECTIKFRTQGLRFRDESDVMNYLNFFCKPCSKAGTVTLTDNEKVSCNRCKRDDVQIKWNLRIRAMDLHMELPCSLQSQATERYLNLDPREGYMMFMQKKEEFQMLLHRANFDTRVCKFQIKTKGVNKYFNILEIYAKDTKQMLNRRMIELKRTIEKFQKNEIKQQKQKEEEKIEVGSERLEIVQE